MRFTSSLALLPLLLALATPTNGAELRPITHEDIWTTARVGTPVIAPDGRHAVVGVTEPSYEEEGDISDLWLITVDGSQPPVESQNAAISDRKRVV